MDKILDKWENVKSEKAPVEEGISNDVYMTDEFVYKYNSNFEKINTEFLVMKNLHDDGVEVPKPLLNSEEHHITVYERINGSSVSSFGQKGRIEVAGKIGEFLNDLHQSNAIRSNSTDVHVDDLLTVHEDYFSAENSFLRSAYRVDDESIFKSLIVRCCEKLEGLQFNSDYEKTVVHMDYHCGNIIFSDQQAHGIDFEHAVVSDSSIDFVHAFLRMGLSNNEEFIDRFVRGYGKEISEVGKSYVCLGFLHECVSARWWEKNYDKTLGKRYDNLENFLEKYIED